MIREDFEKAFYDSGGWNQVKSRMSDFERLVWAAKWAMERCAKSAEFGLQYGVPHEIPNAIRQLSKELEGGV